MSPRHSLISPGVQETATQSPGTPPTEPSTSQYGKSGSVHVPSPQVAEGFAFVQPTRNKTIIKRRPTSMGEEYFRPGMFIRVLSARRTFCCVLKLTSRRSELELRFNW